MKKVSPSPAGEGDLVGFLPDDFIDYEALPDGDTVDLYAAWYDPVVYGVTYHANRSQSDSYTVEDAQFSDDGGNTLTTGFGHAAVLGIAPQIVQAVKDGEIGHFFVVGGCDGIRGSRSYYTEFVKAAPANSVILTVACGKYRFNDLDLGTVAGLPRLFDMGQCNDAYSAVQVALALADAFECDVNELPLSIVLSWYEQKAVCVLLSLLALGIKGIRLGPTLPAFLSPNVTNYLVENFGIAPTGGVKDDLAALLA